ncbi:myeloperoxidase-like [Branchiostoma floridae x Branchiostoma belcheri]
MVTGQTPTEQDLQQAVSQAKSEMEVVATAKLVSGGPGPEENQFSGALNVLATEHRSTPMAKELSRCATVLEKVAAYFMGSSSSISYSLAMLSAIDSQSVTSVCDDTSMQPITCPTPAVPEFRSANGRCNNRDHPLWGSAEQPLRRLLGPDYDDGFKAPRTTGRDGTALPSARLVSTTMHEDLRKSSQVNTHMVMQFGQFLDHDITLTPNFQEEGLICGCDSVDEHCFNINIPSDDPDFTGSRCLGFARSRSCPNGGCHMGRRQQLNQLTAFVDASNVYGSSEEEIEELREHAGKPEQIRRARVCEDETLTISCPAGEHINILFALYGRTFRGICTSGPILTTDCRSRNSRARVRTRCQGKSSCSVTASSSVFGDPCAGTSKYLVVRYTCIGGRGLLKSRLNPADANQKELLPTAMEEGFACDGFNGSETCSQAGDVRVNEQPGLTSMHTVFLREHNRIARRLSQLNPRWDDDRVFFETRKIVGALMQKISYGEDLPHVLGPAAMTKFHLTILQSGFFSGYDASVNPTISNVFATAAYRFGHSLVQNLLLRFTPDNQDSRCPIQLGMAFFNPSHVFDNDQGGPDSILRGLTAQAQQDFDRFMVSSLTKHLFAVPPGSDRGLDLAALNIQRGRDHGLPGYNAWRVRCGLPRANNFDELAFEIPDCFTRKRLENVYSHVDDIDVFVGGLAEESVPGGVVGPTFACLIGLQFQNLRKGDRFWFECPGQFTAAQLAEIRKTSLARILCDNTDGTTHMQPDVFSLPTQPGNERVACSSLSQMDLTKWQE